MPIKKLSCLVVLFSLMSCVKAASSVQMVSTASDVEQIQNHCGWVTVDETQSMTFLGPTLATETRQFNEALFFCCPGDDGKNPECRESDWKVR